MRSWMIGACAVLAGTAAQAQDTSVSYAHVGEWEIATETDRNLCKMYRFYGSTENDDLDGLVIRYDAPAEEVTLTWATTNIPYLPEKGELELYLNFVTGKEFDETWGGRKFRHITSEDTYYLSNVFKGPKESQRILRDLAEKEIIGFDLGPVMLSALFLEAAEATKSLRECSLKLAGGGLSTAALK
jgi:hypothetical protein